MLREAGISLFPERCSVNQKLFFFDIDGTLIDDETKIAPQSAINALAKLRRDGHLVFLNSGRTLCFLEYEMEVFNLTCAACGCGTQIIVNGNTVMEKRIPHERGIEIRHLIRDLKLDAVLEAQQGLYFSDRPFKNSDFMESLLDYAEAFVDTEVNALGDNSYDFDKFCVQTNPLFPDRDSIRKLFAALPDFDPIDRGNGFYECVPKGCSKGSAVDYVREHYHIAPEDVYVFGDSVNDLTMFQSSAGNRIAMGDHDTALERYATFVTKKVMDDGIEHALHVFGLL